MGARRFVGYSVLALILLLTPAASSSKLPWVGTCDSGATSAGPSGPSEALHPPAPDVEGLFPLRSVWRRVTKPQASEALLRLAIRRAQDAKTYRVDIDLQQTVTAPERAYLGANSESVRFQIEGTIGGPERARFSILPAAASFALAQQDPKEFLIVDADVYERVDGRWVDTDSAPTVVGLDGDGLSLLSVAREVERLEPAGDLPADFQGVSFVLHPDDVARFVLVQHDRLDADGAMMARVAVPAVSGSGELWINEAGLPARLALNLSWMKEGRDPYRVHAATTTHYWAFGQRFEPEHFDPAVSPETGAPVAGSIEPHGVQPPLWPLAGPGLLVLFWLLVHAAAGSRRAMVAVTLALILALLAPSVAPAVQAAGLGESAAERRDKEKSPPPAGSEVVRMLDENRALASKYRSSKDPPGPGATLPSDDDADDDGLPNGYEIQLGTNPLAKDSDYDGLTDYEEVAGMPREWGSEHIRVETDPLNPDSNHDGLRDGEEYAGGTCSSTYKWGCAWDDDNDQDDVPDGLDLSPFSHSGSLGGLNVLFEEIAGPDLTFETLDQHPSESVQVPYPFYVEIQIRPEESESLRWAYKHLYWPVDDKGSIQRPPFNLFQMHSIDGGTTATGRLTLVPFLQATVRERDLPGDDAMTHYGVSASPHKDVQGDPVTEDGHALYDMIIPLVTVERGGQVFALQAKMLHDGARSFELLRHWRNLRLKWAVTADVDMPGADPSPTGEYGLGVYDEPFFLTGLQVTRQGGASMLLSAAVPGGNDGEGVSSYDDGPIALLRAGMEGQFLTGKLSIDEIGSRFNVGSGASITETWGITHTYRTVYGAAYSHVDEALATTTMTTTRQLLNEVYADHRDLEPTLILASEQRTSSVNLDDDPTSDYDEITINTCLKPLITSRSLKLQTYRWESDGVVAAAGGQSSGDWQPLTLDEVLQKVEEAYAAVTDPLYEFYYEGLNILKMATTAWHLGQTAVLAMGDLLVQDPSLALSDAEMILFFLDEQGLMPSGFREVAEVVLGVVDAGGPLAWLEQQWNQVMGVVNDVGEILEGGGLDLGSRFDVMGWTQSAINILNLLATITGAEWLGDAARILTKVVAISQKLRELWDAAKAVMDTIGTPLESLGGSLTSELAELAKPMVLIGLILSVGMTWVSVFLQLGHVGGAMTLALLVRAIVDTVWTVVLLVVATFGGAFGAAFAAVFALIGLLGDLLGIPVDPGKLLVELLTTQSQLTGVLTDWPQLDEPVVYPLEPGGGALAGREFSIMLRGTTWMGTHGDGTPHDLNQSSVNLHLGRFVSGNGDSPPEGAPHEARLCTRSEEMYSEYQNALKGYVTSVGTHIHEGSEQLCVDFLLPYRPWWRYRTSTTTQPYAPVDVPGPGWHRQFDNYAYLTMEPTAGINQRLALDVSLDVRYRYETCFGDICDEHTATTTSPPHVADLWYDILPYGLTEWSYHEGLWEWSAIHNPDPDGDGLEGYLSAVTGLPVGPDADLCPNIPWRSSWEEWDTDQDGLSDLFEVETEGFDPCRDDTDGDGVPDGRELMFGTNPADRDTDRDGLNDNVEIPCSPSVYYDPGICPEWERHAWRVEMARDWTYGLLADPVAWPNPRQANLDRDHRDDKQEKEKLSSPNAYNAIPVGDPIDLTVRAGTTREGRTSVLVRSGQWPNDETMVMPTLTITLPVPFSDLELSARVLPSGSGTYTWPTEGALQPPETDNVYQWKLPALWYGRYVDAHVEGLPDLPSEPVTVTAQLSYTEVGVPQVATAARALPVNPGGPASSLSGIKGARVLVGADAAALPGLIDGQVTLAGTADDPEQVSQVYVCVKDTDDCAGADWQLANGTQAWSHTFTPPDDDVYYVRTYALDGDGLAGPVSDAWMIGVDQTPPSSVAFDLQGTAYLSTTVGSGEPRFITLTGWVSDTTGAGYVSGAADVIVQADGQTVDGVSAADRGEAGSGFAARWAPLTSGFGRSIRTESGAHVLNVVAGDAAGNASPVSDTLRVVVDDTPPVVYAPLPQAADDDELALSGLADDTALIYDRQPTDPFGASLTVADRDAGFVADDAPITEAVIVADVSGDTIDDVVLLAPGRPDAGVPLQVGLVFGRRVGLSGPLTLADADVVLSGPASDLAGTYPPRAASAGDVNGDGVGDLLIGNPQEASGEGEAYLVLGRRGTWPSSLDLAGDGWVLGVSGTTGFGATVAPAGDVNGDGLSDFLVGAASLVGAPIIGFYNSVAWLYLGREQGVAGPRVSLYGPVGVGAVPPNLAGVGDTDGDGLSDILIAQEGAPVALMLGRPDGEWPSAPAGATALADALFYGSMGQQTVSPAGDVNGDGLQDILIGDPYASPPKVYVVFGRRPEHPWPGGFSQPPLDDLADASFVETEWSNSRLGLALTTLGDVDRDGRDDFAFGQPGAGEGSNRAAIVRSGAVNLAPDVPVASASTIISGTSATQQCGAYLSTGDVSGDQVPDLLVGTGEDGHGHLFLGAFNPGGVAGIEGVELGAYGPVSDPTLAVTATLPGAWSAASLAEAGEAVSAWVGAVPVSGDGDYRVYARARDRAGNRLAPQDWYLGEVRIAASDGGGPLQNGEQLTIEPPRLGHQTELTVTGVLTSSGGLRHLQVYDGHRWHRVPPDPGAWSVRSDIPRSEQRTLTLHAVARDAVGATLHATHTLSVDTLVGRPPLLSANLPVAQWQTDISPTLAISWTEVSDANGIAGTWASIGTTSDTSPTSGALGDSVTLELTEPGVYYAHVRVEDGVGNEHIAHAGPFPVNRTRTPSAILPDGHLDLDMGEWPATTLLNYDPYAPVKPAALWGTWNSGHLYLGTFGAGWGPSRRFSVYLDTGTGGLTTTMPAVTATHVHTLPFAADYAFTVGGATGDAYALHAAYDGEWTPRPQSPSFAVTGVDTEIGLEREGIDAYGSVEMLAFAEDEGGVWAVLPAGARPTTAEAITGPITFEDSFSWPGLDPGIEPAAGQTQVIEPNVVVNPGWDTVLIDGQTTAFTLTVGNPDIGAFAGVPLTVETPSLMGLTGVSGASCLSCPPEGSRWVLAADVAAGSAQTITLSAVTLAEGVSGVVPVTVTAELADTGLPSAARSVPRGRYVLDHGVGAVEVLRRHQMAFVQSGENSLPIVPQRHTAFHRCTQRVEANTGTVWSDLGLLGDLLRVEGEVPKGGLREWQVRVASACGRASQVVTRTLVADDVAPTAGITHTRYLTGTFGFLRGTTSDEFPTTRAPRTVEVSMDGGRFQPAVVSPVGEGDSSRASWLFPLDLPQLDGEAMTVVARAVDEAGNVSPETEPLTIIVDNTGPTLTHALDGYMLTGTATDGSGVALVEVSLDGGASYEAAALGDGTWAYDLPSVLSWDIALIRARDVLGNTTREVVVLAPPQTRTYLPVVMRR